MPIYKIYASPATGNFEDIILKLLSERESFELHNIDNNQDAYSFFLEITGGNVAPPIVIGVDGKIVEMLK